MGVIRWKGGYGCGMRNYPCGVHNVDYYKITNYKFTNSRFCVYI